MEQYDLSGIPEMEEEATTTMAERAERAQRIQETMPSDKMAELMVQELDLKLARSIKLLHVEDQTILAEYFIIATGNSNTQVRALSGYLEERMKKEGIEPLHMEGYREASWILMDYAGVIVHIFTPETRQFYNLEKLWSAAREVDITHLLTQD